MATLWHPFITTVAITSLPMRPSAYYIPPTDPPTKPLSPCNGTFHSLCQRQHRPREQPQQLHLMFLQRQACASEITPCYACTLQSCSCASPTPLSGLCTCESPFPMTVHYHHATVRIPSTTHHATATVTPALTPLAPVPSSPCP